MTEHTDASEYVKAGFLVGVYESWLPAFPEDEWGDLLGSYWEAASAALSLGHEDHALTLIGWIRAELDAAFTEQQEWIGEYSAAILTAQNDLAATLEYWDERSRYFNAPEAFTAARDALPSWMKPPAE